MARNERCATEETMKDQEKIEQEFFRVRQLAVKLGISRSKLYADIEAKRLLARRLDSILLVPKSAVEDYLKRLV